MPSIKNDVALRQHTVLKIEMHQRLRAAIPRERFAARVLFVRDYWCKEAGILCSKPQILLSRRFQLVLRLVQLFEEGKTASQQLWGL